MSLFPSKVFISVKEASRVGFFEQQSQSTDGHNLKVFDCRFSLDDPLNYGRNVYLKGHLPNALFVDLDTELSGDLTVTPARHPLPKIEDFIALCVKAGLILPVENGSTTKENKKRTACLCYDDQAGGLAAARMWWMLQNLGVEAYILDGGIQCYVDIKAKEEKNANATPSQLLSTDNVLTKNIPGASSERIAYWPYAKQWTHIATSAEIIKTYLPNGNETSRTENAAPLYVDARFALRYNSSCRSYAGDKLAGHVPNSINRPWNANVMVPLSPPVAPSASSPVPPLPVPCGFAVLRPFAELRAEFFELVPKGKGNHNESIFSCASGVTACMNIAVCHHVGLGIPRLYAGAWSEFESLNRSHFIAKAHKSHGFRLDMVKKVNPVGAIRAHSNQLRVTPAPGRNISSKIANELKRKAAECLFVDEVADIYLLKKGKEVLIGRVEVVASTLHPSTSVTRSKL